MKSRLILFLILLLSFFSYSQENCSNGIDDDGDGLIDLNDPDCTCNQLVNIPSLIPNPSFELYDYCPSSFSQMDAAQTWIQATDATSDYYNSNTQCNFVISPISDNGLNNFPDGTGIVGALYIDIWKEYVGAKLLSPMLAGTTYNLKLNIAALTINATGGNPNYSVSNYKPTNVTIYGCADGNNLPVITTASPDTIDPTWVVLGQASYTPISAWGDLTIQFTPLVNIGAIMIGPEQVLPPAYTYTFGIEDPVAYFLYDNLILNQSSLFNSAVTASITGNFCSNNVVLHTAINNQIPETTYTYQWYNNGIAIIGATSANYSVPGYNATDSYSVRVFDGTTCLISNSITTQTIITSPPTVISPLTYCQFDTATTLTAIGNNLLWYTTATGGSGSSSAPIPVTTAATNTTYYVSQTCSGFESIRVPIQINVNTKIHPDFTSGDQFCFQSEIPSLNNISPNGVTGIWNPEVVNNIQSQQYTFTPITGVCAFSQTIDINVIPPIDFHLEGGCNIGQYYITAIPESGSFDLSALQFAWTNNIGTVISGDEPSINLTEIVNNTVEEEQFPLPFGLTITDANNCSTYHDINIEKVFCTIQKGISLNEDDQNDFFDLRGLNVSHLNIYNRYGMIVYNKDNYTTEWKGQSNSGAELPSGTYYYSIQMVDNDSKYGWIYVLR